MSALSRKKKSRVRNAEKGFTLMELMVVIIILGLLVSLVGPKVIERFKKAKHRIACIDIQNISTAIQEYYMDFNELPEDLEVLWSPSDEDVDPYLKSEPIDPWGNPYYYYPEGGSEFELKSLGADGQEGGDKDNKDINKEDALREFRKKNTE